MAACLWQGQPDASNMQVYDAIQRSADLFQAPTPKLGHGIPDFVRARLLLSGYSPASVESDELLRLFPNPFIEQVSGVYYSSENQQVTVRLVNTLGQTVRSLGINACEMCVHSFHFDGLGRLSVGNYVVEVLVSKGKLNRKVVKATW
jgi:hypothetical protein